MNPEALKQAFEDALKRGYTGDFDSFKKLMSTDANAVKLAWSVAINGGYKGTPQDFYVLLNGESAPPVEIPKIFPINYDEVMQMKSDMSGIEVNEMSKIDWEKDEYKELKKKRLYFDEFLEHINVTEQEFSALPIQQQKELLNNQQYKGRVLAETGAELQELKEYRDYTVEEVKSIPYYEDFLNAGSHQGVFDKYKILKGEGGGMHGWISMDSFGLPVKGKRKEDWQKYDTRLLWVDLNAAEELGITFDLSRMKVRDKSNWDELVPDGFYDKSSPDYGKGSLPFGVSEDENKRGMRNTNRSDGQEGRFVRMTDPEMFQQLRKLSSDQLSKLFGKQREKLFNITRGAVVPEWEMGGQPYSNQQWDASHYDKRKWTDQTLGNSTSMRNLWNYFKDRPYIEGEQEEYTSSTKEETGEFNKIELYDDPHLKSIQEIESLAELNNMTTQEFLRKFAIGGLTTAIEELIEERQKDVVEKGSEFMVAGNDVVMNPYFQVELVDDRLEEIDVLLERGGLSRIEENKLITEKNTLQKVAESDMYVNNAEKRTDFEANFKKLADIAGMEDNFIGELTNFILDYNSDLDLDDIESGSQLFDMMNISGDLLEYDWDLNLFKMTHTDIMKLAEQMGLSELETTQFIKQFESLLRGRVKSIDDVKLKTEFYDHKEDQIIEITNNFLYPGRYGTGPTAGMGVGEAVKDQFLHDITLGAGGDKDSYINKGRSETGTLQDSKELREVRAKLDKALKTQDVRTIVETLEEIGWFQGKFFEGKREDEVFRPLNDIFNHFGVAAYASVGGRFDTRRIGNNITIAAGNAKPLILNTNQSTPQAALAEGQRLKDYILRYGRIRNIDALNTLNADRRVSEWGLQLKDEKWIDFLATKQEHSADKILEFQKEFQKELQTYNDGQKGQIEAAQKEISDWIDDTQPTLQIEIDQKIEEVFGKLNNEEAAWKSQISRAQEAIQGAYGDMEFDRVQFNKTVQSMYYMESRKGSWEAATIDSFLHGIEDLVLGVEYIATGLAGISMGITEDLTIGGAELDLAATERNLTWVSDLVEPQRGFLSQYGPNTEVQSPEYMAELQQTFMGGAWLGLVRSAPAMLASWGIGGVVGTGVSWVGRTAALGARSMPFIAQVFSTEMGEMNTNPAFKDATEIEKWCIAAPIAIATGVLEEYGFRNLMKGSSGFIGKTVFETIEAGGAQMTKKQFKQAFLNRVLNKIKTGGIRILKGGLAEAETGGLQEISTTLIKESVELIKDDVYVVNGENYSLDGVKRLASKEGLGLEDFLDKEGIAKLNIFETSLDDGILAFAKSVGVAAGQEMMGGFMISTISALNQGYKEHKFGKLATDMQFKYTEWATRSANNMKMWKAHLKDQLAKGDLEQDDYNQLLNNLEKNAATFREVPQYADLQDRKEAFDLITEKKQLEEQIEKSKSDKNSASTISQQERVKEINTKLESISSYANKKGQRQRVNTPILNRAMDNTELLTKKEKEEVQAIIQSFMKRGMSQQFAKAGIDIRGIESMADAVAYLENLSTKFKNSGNKSKQNVADDIDKMIGFIMNEASSSNNVISIDISNKAQNGKTQEEIENLYEANTQINGDLGETVYFINNKAVSGRVFEEKMNNTEFQEELKSGKSNILILGASLNTRNQYTGEGSIMNQMIEEGAEGVKDIVKETGIAEAVEVFDTSDKMAEALRKRGNVSEEQIKEAVESDGFFLDGNEIWINKEMAAKVGAIGVGSHELLHALLKSKIQDANTGLITADGIALIDKFKRKLSKKDLAAIEERIEKFDKYELIEEEVDGKKVQKKVEKAKEKYYSEYLTYFSDLISLGTSTTQGKSWWKDFGNTLTFNYFKPAGFKNAKFTDAKSVYHFVKSYAEAFKAGKFKEIAEKVAKDKKIDTTPTGKTDFSKTVNEEISDLQSQKANIIEDQKRLVEEKGDKSLMKENVKNIASINSEIKNLKGKLKKGQRRVKTKDKVSKTEISATNKKVAAENARLNEVIIKEDVRNEDGELVASESVKDQLIENNLRKVTLLAGKAANNPNYFGQGVSFDDWFSGYYEQLTRLASTYRPEETPGDFGAYMNKNLPRRYGQILKGETAGAMKKTVSIDKQVEGKRKYDIVSTEKQPDEILEAKEKTKAIPTKALLSTKLGVKKAKVHYKNIVEKAKKLKKKDIPTTYKGTKDLDTKGTVDMFLEDPTSVYQKGKTKGNNIAESITDKLLNNKDLNKQDIEALQPFINKHADALMAGAISEGATPGGKSTGVQNVLLEALFTKTQRAKMAKTGSAQGLPIQVKQGINSKFRNKFLSLMGLTPSGESNIRDIGLSSQSIKAVLAQTGKIMSNQAIREAHPSAKKIGEGKSKIMWSKSVAPTSPIKLTHLNDVVDLSYSDITSQKGYEALSKKGNNGNWNLTKEERFQADMFLRKIAPLLPKNFFHSGNLSHSRALFPNMTYVDKVLNGEMYTREELLSLGVKEDVVDQLMQPVVFNEKMNDQPTRFKYNIKGKFKTHVGSGKNKMTIASYFKSDKFLNNEAKKMPFLKQVFEVIQSDLKTNPEHVVFWEALLRDAQNSMGHFVKTMAPLTAYPKNYKGKIREEHSMPQHLVAKYLLNSAINNTLEKDFENIEKHYFQVALKLKDDLKLSDAYGDITGIGYNFDKRMPDFHELGMDTWIRYLNFLVNKNKGGINPNDYVLIQEGGTLADKYNLGITTADIQGLGATIRSVITPKVVAYQIKLAEQVIKGEITPKVARNRLMKMLPLAKPMQKAAMDFSKTVNSSGVVLADPTTMTGEEILSLAMSMDQALAVARDPNAPVKKIRVFDFDDTLAKTKSRVIYNKPNTTGKPSSNLKAIVMAGGPGSGKSTVIRGLGLQKQGYKVVNQDISLEWAKKLVGLPAGEADYDAVQRSARSELGALARKIADKKLTQYTNQGTGVILDGTGASLKATKAKVQALKDMGYEVSMVYVETSKETALERNRKRKERSLKDFIVDKTWDSVNANKQDYKNEFGESFFEVNTDNLAQKFQLPTEVVESVNLKLNENIRGRLQPGQFAEVGAQMQEDGATFDFNEFNRVIDGKKGPLFEVAKKIQAARGTEDVFVLTARPQEAAGAIHEFLDSIGLKIPIKNITGLESSSPFAKSQWVVEKAAEGYNDFYFADDHLANVEAVQEALDQLDVKSKTQQAKMDFSMTTKRNLKWKKTRYEAKTKFEIEGKTYTIELARHVDSRDYSLVFGLEHITEKGYRKPKLGITGTGNAAEVLSIISNGVVDFIKKNKVNSIHFISNEGSRSRLYTTLTKLWAGELGWNHKIEYDPDYKDMEGAASFVMTKPVGEPRSSFSNRLKPIKKVLNVIDVKGKTQQTTMEFSKTKEIDSAFNLIIEQKTGIGAKKVFSNAKARVRGKGKGKFKFFIPDSHEDFVGLLYKTLAKGKLGDDQLAWYKEVLLQPFARGMNNLANAENALRNDFKALKKILVKEGIPKNLNKKIKDGKLKGYTYQDVIRILAWENQGIEVDGLSKTDLKAIQDLAKEKPELQIFAEQLVEINKGDGYYYPGADWTVGTITTDILDGLNNVKRAKYLAEWQENVDIIFSSKNMNKLHAAYGERYVEALDNILTRMRTGKNRTTGKYARIENRLLDYLNNSVGAVMFFNTRSAVLQTLSTVNFINWKDNNVIAASKAFANQPQYWKDFIEIMNSDFLVSRRNGLKLNVSESEIADAAAREKNKFRGAMAYMLDKGFMFTKFGDSFAIAAGGATFYRNRINTYIEQGMNEIDAQKQAWDDFRELAEENQQSARPDRISMQQASNIGRVILAFANTPSQYARIMKKSFLDLINGRGDWKANVSRIVYYSTVQNLIFTALQKALFALAFDDEEDEEKKQKYYDTANSMLDNILRGLGWGGALVSMMKNVGIDIYERSDEENQSYKGAEYWKSTFKLFDFSPPLDIKVQKFQRALENWEYNSWRPELNDPFSIDNPAYKSLALMIAATTNIPLDRLLQKTQNIEAALQEDQETWKRIALVLGWPEWQLETSGKKDLRIKEDRKEKLEMRAKIKPNLYTKEEQVSILKQHGYNQAAIDELKNEDDRVNAILKSQEDNNKIYTPTDYKKDRFDSPKDKKEKKEAIEAKEVVEEQSDSDKVYDLKKDEQVRALKDLGVTKKEIDSLRIEGPRVDKILEIQKEKGFDLDSLINSQVNYKPTKQEKLYKELEGLNKADQIKKLKKGGLSDEDIKKLKYEKDRIEAIMKLKND